jgi:N4-gp56 family major capsid protein
MDVGKQAVERLGYQMAKTIERVTANAIINNLSVAGQNVHHRFKTSTEFTDYYGMTSTISAGVMTVSATNILAVSDIKNAVFELRKMGAKPWSGNDYVAIMPTEVAEDIAGDSTFTGFHQYVEKGVDALYNGELGKVYGCRLIDAPEGPCKRGSNYGATASSIAYATIVMGKGFYGAVEFFGEGTNTYMVKGASKSDPLNQFSIFGWKANYAAKVLNPSAGLVLWTGSRDTTAACAESANSGLRNEDPSDY